MATRLVEFDAPQGLTLTLELYTPGTDTLAATRPATERTNDRGCYYASLVNLATGLYRARARNANGYTICRGLLRHTDATGTERPSTDDTAQTILDDAPEDFWTYSRRTLTTPAAAIAATQLGSAITLYRGDSESLAFTDLGDLTDATELWLTAKDARRLDDTDTDAILQITLTGGLTIVAGSTPTTGQTASITITDTAAGNLTIAISAAATAILDAVSTGQYDIQALFSSGLVTTLTTGTFKVSRDVTRATA
jgi:hypothetical protein